MSPNEVLVRSTSDKDVREYHIGQLICDQPFAEFTRPTWGSENQFHKLGPIGEQIAESLMSPDHGETIERISFRPYSVRVRKSPNANWGFLEPNIIIEALKDAMDVDTLDVQSYSTMKLRQLVHA